MCADCLTMGSAPVAEITRSTSRTIYRRRRRRWPRVLVVALLVAAAAAGATFGIRLLLAHGETMPGVQVLGADVGGLDRSAASARIAAAAAAGLHRPVTVLVGDRTLTPRRERVRRVRAAPTAEGARPGGRGVGAGAAALLSPAPPARAVEPVLAIRRHEAGAYLDALRRLGRPP